MKANTLTFAAIFAALLSMPAVAETIASPARPTAKCNPEPHNPGIYMDYAVAQNDPLIVEMVAVARNPALNPVMYERMGKPTGVVLYPSTMALNYEPIQDMEEMAARFRADTQLASKFLRVLVNQASSDFIRQRPPDRPIREYFHAGLNHYYLSSNLDEMKWLDAGGGGGGWVRTGESWTTAEFGLPGLYSPEYKAVYMFYGTPGVGPNSHYFTASPEECGHLRNTVGWTYGGIPFAALRPVVGGCPTEAPVGLHMLYNNRAAQNDSNHRYTTDTAIYAAMQAQGWTGYGVQLCVKMVGAQSAVGAGQN